MTTAPSPANTGITLFDTSQLVSIGPGDISEGFPYRQIWRASRLLLSHGSANTALLYSASALPSV